jgi:hypothetical protein
VNRFVTWMLAGERGDHSASTTRCCIEASTTSAAKLASVTSTA